MMLHASKSSSIDGSNKCSSVRRNTKSNMSTYTRSGGASVPSTRTATLGSARWRGALRWIAAAACTAIGFVGPDTVVGGDTVAHAADGFTIARSSRLGVEVRMPGERDSWCAERVAVDVIAADPEFFTPDGHTEEGEETSADFRRLVRRLVALLRNRPA